MSNMSVIQGTREPALTKAQIADLKIKHGDDLYRVSEDGTSFVFRPPSAPEFARWVGATNKKRDDFPSICERLSFDCLVWPLGADGQPDEARLGAVFAKKAGIGMNIAGKIADLAGAGDDLNAGKL
jgi:hypothetical protein